MKIQEVSNSGIWPGAYVLNEKETKKWMRLAKAVKEVENPCYSRQIGVVIVDPYTNALVSSGHNGPPQNCPPNDDYDYLKSVVWPQLTEDEKLKAKGHYHYEPDVKYNVEDNDKFATNFGGCRTCPRKPIGAPSGKRLELCTCLSYKSKIRLGNGKLAKIGELVENKYSGLVESYDILSSRVVNKRVIGWYKNELEDNNWYKITTRYGRCGRWGNLGAKFTKSHEIFTTAGWKRIDRIKPGDKIFIPENKLNDTQVQIILGSCLGDGTLSKPSGSCRFSVFHAKKHTGYIDYKSKLLGFLKNQITNDVRDKITPNGTEYKNHEMKKLWTECCIQLSKFRDLVYPNGKKRVSEEWLSYVDELGLAMWYMDDGSIISDRCGYIAVHKFIKDYKIIVNWLEEKFQINTRLTTGKRLYFDSVAFDKLSKIIAAYVPECMKYKILPKYRNVEIDNCNGFKNSGLAIDEVISVKEVKCLSTEKKYSYCIDVEDTHNFITNNCVAHNCIHGEVDAITRANRDVSGCYLFCYCGVPCIECTKVIINAGIDIVIAIDHGKGDYSLYSSRWLFEKSRVKLILQKEDWFWKD